MTQPVTFGSRLRTLGLALLNATLLLAILLVMAAALLVARVQHLADTATEAVGAVTDKARTTIAEDIPKVTDTLARLTDLQGRLDAAMVGADTATAAELAALRGEVQVLTVEVAGLSDSLHRMGANGYQALVNAMRTVLAETSTRIEAQLPENRGTE